MSETERSTGVGSSSNKCEPKTEVFSTNDNLNSSNGDEIMMDTTERGMASPCEKMEAENVIDWSNNLPQTTDSDEDEKYLMCNSKLFGLTVRTIFTDPEELKRLYNDKTLTESEFYFKSGRLIWYCLKDIGDEIESTDHKNQLDLLSNPKDDSAIFTNRRIKSESFKGVKITPLANRGQLFVSSFGAFEILSKTELNSPSVAEFQNELYHNILPSLLWTGKAEISPEYAEKIGTDAPAPAVTQETGTGLAPVTGLSPIAQLVQAHDAERQAHDAERKALIAYYNDEIAKRDNRIDYLEKSEKSSRATAATYGRERSRRNDELEKCRETIQKQSDMILVLNQKIEELEAKIERLKTEKTELDESWKDACKMLKSQLVNCERDRDEAQRKLRVIEGKYIPASSIVGRLHLDVTDKYLKCTITTLVQKTFYSGDFDPSLEPMYIGVYMFHPKVVEAFIHGFVQNPRVLDRIYWTAEFTKHYEDGTLAEWVGDTLAKKSNLTLIE